MKTKEYKRRYFRKNGLKQMKLENGEDLLHLKDSDIKEWTVLAASNSGLQADARMLELLDGDGDGKVQIPDLLAAIDWLNRRGVKLDSLFEADPSDAEKLAKIMRKQPVPVDEEKALRYKMGLAKYLKNFVNQENLYVEHNAIYLTGKLFIDGRECLLCFHVDDEEAHSALAEKSNCCVIYLKLTRNGGEAETRNICAVITAGRTATLYVGRNGLFYDCEGKAWNATITKMIAAQVSLREAFWSPWKKTGEVISEQVKKFIGAKQEKAQKDMMNGAAIASSVAAIGIGVGMMGTAFAGAVGLITGMPWWKTAAGIVLVILAISLPSMVLAWFKLRRRDLGGVLNASGWAVNRKLGFSQKSAAEFTKEA